MPSFTNKATLIYNNNSIDSNVVRGEIVAPITATKTALTGSYAPGDDITFAVSFVSDSDAELTGLTITDDLGAYEFNGAQLQPLDYIAGSARLFIDGELQPQPTVSAGSPLTVSGIDIPAGADAVLVYSARVNSYAPMDDAGSIVNTAGIRGDGICVEVDAQAELVPGEDALLSIEKSLFPCSLSCNESITYTFTVINRGLGEAVATDNIVITDVFDPAINITSVTLNGAELTEGDGYTYSAETGEFATVAGYVTVPGATYSQDPETGKWVVEPGESVLVVTGTV